ncbi:MAG: hypothetical protein AABY00_04070 [Nanoarchaeota archaeon]
MSSQSLSQNGNGCSDWFLWTFTNQIPRLPADWQFKVEKQIGIEGVVRFPLRRDPEYQIKHELCLHRKFLTGKIRLVTDTLSNSSVLIVTVHNNDRYSQGLALSSSTSIAFSYSEEGKNYGTKHGMQILPLIGDPSKSFLERALRTHAHEMIQKPTYRGNREVVFYGLASYKV